MQQSGRFVLGLLTATIISTGGVRVGVARHLLHRHNIGPGIQQISHEGAAKIVGGEIFHARFFGPLAQHVVDGLVSQTTAVVSVA